MRASPYKLNICLGNLANPQYNTIMNPGEIKTIIEDAIPSSIVTVDGDGVHFEAIVVSSEFEGKGLLEQHQMVYKALGELMKDIHALSLKTYTPDQWKRVR